MIQKNVIAQNITNLTDARYFAAWGVRYLSFNLINDSAYFLAWEKIQEIIEWVEGPKTLIEANAIEFLEGIDGHILSNIYSSLPLNKESFFRTSMQEVKSGLTKGNYIVKIEDKDLEALSSLDYSQESVELFLDISDVSLSTIKQLPDFGFVIQGGEEEKLGVKSYDDLDELFEFLMD